MFVTKLLKPVIDLCSFIDW